MSYLECPNPKECILYVKDSKIYCETHNKFLNIVDNWDDKKHSIPLRHILYVARSTSKEGEILIDEEM